MFQICELDSKTRKPTLGRGQQIEEEMAIQLGIKIIRIEQRDCEENIQSIGVHRATILRFEEDIRE